MTLRTWLRSPEVATHETDQAIKLVRNLRQAHIDMLHTLFMQVHALGLEFLHLSLAALDLGHHHGGVLKLPDFFLEVHLTLV